MTRQQLIRSMVAILNKNFTRKADKDTVHRTVLRESDGEGQATSKRIYKALVRWTLKKHRHQRKPWPKNWMALTVAELAERII